MHHDLVQTRIHTVDVPGSLGRSNESRAGELLQVVSSELNATTRGEDVPVEIAVYKETLRSLVDIWINTGRHGGVEEPLTRSVTNSLAMREGSETIKNLYDFTSELKADTVLTDTGAEVALSVPVLVGRGLAAQRGRNAAYSCFLRLIESGQSARLARCDHCRSYWIRRRMPRRGITHGVFCVDCRSKGSERRRDASRADKTTALVSVAAAVLSRYQRSHPEPDSKKLAFAINREIDRRTAAEQKGGIKSRKINTAKTLQSVSGNWVTRHRDEIDQKANGTENGKDA